MSALNPEEIKALKCPSCQYPIGDPLDKKAEGIKVTKEPAMCFCVRCLAVCYVSTEEPPKLVPNKDLFGIILLRPKEMLRTLEFLLVMHKNLPRIDAEKN